MWPKRATGNDPAANRRLTPEAKMSATPEYRLYCFAQSGNCYRVALMLNLIGADWVPVFVDFFVGGETRTPEYRAEINEMGEAPVLAHGARKLSQSAVCLTYLAERSGKFRPEGEGERLECLRWLVFDNQKVNGFLGPYRFLKNFAPNPNPGGEAFLLPRIVANLAIVDRRLSKAPYLLGARPTIADISLVGYLYYPVDEFGFDIARDHPAIGAWMERIKALPGWKHPYDLMPGYPMKQI
jgi:glutathione S-transferase